MADISFKTNDIDGKEGTEKKEEKEDKKEKEKEDKKEKVNLPSVEFSRHLQSFFTENNFSLVISSYKSNVLFCFGTHESKFQMWLSNFSRPMESYYDKENEALFLGTSASVVKCVNSNTNRYDNENHFNFDGNFIPKSFHIIGDVDIHDIEVVNNEVYFVSAQMNAVCKLNMENSLPFFEVVKTPHFITKIANEDRCHLNSLLFIDNKLKYGTSVAETDFLNAWRENRENNGVVIDFEHDRIVCDGLTMPHSLRQYKNRIYLLNSGTAEFGFLHPKEDGNFEFKSLCFIPGFLRSLDFINNYAVIGASEDRYEKCFSGLPLHNILKSKKVTPKCGIYFVNLDTCDIEHQMLLPQCQEIYGISVIENKKRCRVLDFLHPTLSKIQEYK